MKDIERGEKGSEARWKVLLHGAHHCARGNNHCYETNFQFYNASGETPSICPASTDVWRLEYFFCMVSDDPTFGGYKARLCCDNDIIYLFKVSGPSWLMAVVATGRQTRFLLFLGTVSMKTGANINKLKA